MQQLISKSRTRFFRLSPMVLVGIWCLVTIFLPVGVIEAANLKPYSLPGWLDEIVVSTEAGTHTDSLLDSESPLYVDWAFANYGPAEVPGTTVFMVMLSVDGSAVKFWQVTGGVSLYSVVYFEDFNIGYLCPGLHTIQLTIDPYNAVAETNEDDNTYTKTVTVLAGSDPHIEVCPRGYEFGELAGDQTLAKRFVVSNVGGDFLSVGDVQVSGPDADCFTVDQNECTPVQLPPRGCTDAYTASCRITVTFAPLRLGELSAELRIPSNDPQRSPVVVTLGGVAIAPPGDVIDNGSGAVDLADVIGPLRVVTATPASGWSPQPGNAGGRLGLEDAIFVARRLAPLYETVYLKTGMGDIRIWLLDNTPGHRDNFLSLVRSGFYDGRIFHRVIDGFMIQGGSSDGTGSGGPGYTLPAEIDCTLSHVYGAVAAARLGDELNSQKRSSGSQFYIVENSAGAHPLDGAYTIFGLVIDGMAVVEAIAAVETDHNDKPLEEVVIIKAEVAGFTRDGLWDQFGFPIPPR